MHLEQQADVKENWSYASDWKFRLRVKVLIDRGNVYEQRDLSKNDSAISRQPEIG